MRAVRAWIGVCAASLVLHAALLFAPAGDVQTAARRPQSEVDLTLDIEPLDTDERTTRNDHAPSSAEGQDNPGRGRAMERVRQGSQPMVDQSASKHTAVRVSVPDTKGAARAWLLANSPVPEARGPANHESAPGLNYFEGVGAKDYLSVREPPPLRSRGDGTYHFRGNTFMAVVARDGSVSFEDRVQQGTTVTFDITDHMMRKRGEDPYRVEKQWFLDSTERFRASLFERWHEERMTLSLTKLRTRLLRILEDETLSDGDKAARVVALYRDTAKDELGKKAQDLVAEFVGRNMPGLRLPARSE